MSLELVPVPDGEVAVGLTEAQTKAAHLLGRGQTRKATAIALGVHESTISQWKKLQPFKDELARVANEDLEELGAKFTAAKISILDAIPYTVEKLLEAMEDVDHNGVPTGSAVRAMEVLLSKFPPLKEMGERAEGSGAAPSVINVIRTDAGAVTIETRRPPAHEDVVIDRG